MRRLVLLPALAVLLAACQGPSAPPPPPVAVGPPAIPDAQPVTDAPLFVGQNAFAAALPHQTDYTPVLASLRADGGNSGVFDGPAPLGRAPVTGSAAVAIQPPLLWGRSGLISGCQMEVSPGVTRACLAAVDASTLTVTSRWTPPDQDLNLIGAVIDDGGRVILTTRQRHVLVVATPTGPAAGFRVIRDVDLSSHLGSLQGLAISLPDASGNLWFTSGGPLPSDSTSTAPTLAEGPTSTASPTSAAAAAATAGPASTSPSPTGPTATGAATTSVVGYVTSGDQVAVTFLANQQVGAGLAVDQTNVYLTTVPAGLAEGVVGTGLVYDFTAVAGQVQAVWRAPFDAGTSLKAGATGVGSAAPVVLLGNQYLAMTDNSDDQSHLLVYQRGLLPTGTATTSTTSTTTSTTSTTASSATSTTSTSTTAATSPPAGSNPSRLVCRVALFTPGASAVTTAPIGYSSGDVNSVIVANGANAPAALSSPTDAGPANSMSQMPGGVTRIDVMAGGSGCQTRWTAAVRIKPAPVLSSTTGLVYGYTQDDVRAGAGSYVWYFVAIDYRSGHIVWRQRVGAGSTKNDNRLPTVLGANGVLYQTLPLGLVWMRDVSQHP